ncbi:MAG: Gldg family protein [Patescibacteria group bacterium]
MNKRVILIIAKKELLGFINSPLAYTAVVPFLLLSVFLYTRSLLISGEATLRPFFDLLPWFLLLLAPALSMKALSDEYRNNTLELLFAHPLSETEIVLGKFFGVAGFYLLVLLTTAGLPLTLFAYSRPDPGQIVAQYLGAFLLGSLFISVGLAASAYVKNAISSFLLSASVSFVLLILGLDFIVMTLPAPFSWLATQISVLTHTDNIARGLLDIRDAAYFATITGLFLAMAVMKLSSRRLVESPLEKRKLNLALAIIIGIGLMSNLLLTAYPLRVDLTANRLFSISAGTRQTLRTLPDVVTVTVFASKDLPAQTQLTEREITDLLKDYARIGRNLKVVKVHPEENSETATEARNSGIQEITFNKIGTGKFEAQTGFLGLSLRFGDKTESIPYISDTSDLEYQLTRRIRKLTGDKDKIIGLLSSGDGAQNQLLNQILSYQYRTETLSDGDYGKLKDIAALIVIDDGSRQSTASALIKTYLQQNGHALILASGVTVNQQNLTASKSLSSVPEALKEFGITINNDIAYDLQLNELLTFGSGNSRFLAPYPYWLKAVPTEAVFSPLSSIKSLSLGWPSSITIEEKAGFKYKKLIVTGGAGGRVSENFNLYPESIRTLGTTDGGKVYLAGLVEKEGMRAVVIGNSSIAEDRFLQSNRDNAAFLANTIDYLASDADLAAIPAKTAGRAILQFHSPNDPLIVQYGNLLVPPLLVVAFAVWHLRRRKQKTLRLYEK